jgi:hypothetical protein
MIDWLEPGTKAVGILGGLIAAAFALFQARMSLDQRRRDLRWKQAEMAKKVVDEWFDFEPSKLALQMTEGRKRRYPTGGRSEIILYPEVLDALSHEIVRNEHPDLFIQDCFDSLFYFWDRTEQFLCSGLVRFEDVQRPTEFYIGRMAGAKDVFRRYAESIGYTGALAFMNRFSVWKQAPERELNDNRRDEKR